MCLKKILINLSLLAACEPKMMPTYPQHRNMKSAKSSSSSVNPPPPPSMSDTGSMDQTMNLPAISDLVCILNCISCLSIKIFFILVNINCLL